MTDNILEKYSRLDANQKKIVNWAGIIIAVLILYLIVFSIAKCVVIGKIKDVLVSKGIGSSPENITLKISINPFFFWMGKVSSAYLKADTVRVKDMFLLHDFEVRAKKINLRKLNNIENDYIEGNVVCKIYENDFLSLLNERMSRNNIGGINVSMNLGVVRFLIGGAESEAEPFLKNNGIYLKFTKGVLTYAKPVKLVDFGFVTKNRLNVYEFEYSKGVYELKGTII